MHSYTNQSIYGYCDEDWEEAQNVTLQSHIIVTENPA